MGVNQIQHKKETFWAEEDEANNMKLNRTIKQKDLLWSKIVGTLRRDKEGQKFKTEGPFAIDKPTSLLRNHRTKWRVKLQQYRDQYASVITVLCRIQHLCSIKCADQVLAGEKEPLEWHTLFFEIDEVWSSQPTNYQYFPLFYTNENDYTVRIEEDGSETVFYNTISVVVVE
jgi:hypothetical protein